MQAALEARGIEPLASGSEYVATSPVELDEDAATEVLALVDRLEQDDDVQHVFHNLA
ncbi:MAG: YebC/PmpR family DNA-binding transcriptional regulator [bacterium]